MTTPAHLGGAYMGGDANTIMEDVWGYLAVRYGVTSVLDIGCGYGHAQKWFEKHNIPTLGIEGDPVAVAGHLLPGHVIHHDFTTGPFDIPESPPIDLCWCSEFVEHVEERFISNYMAAMSHCRIIVITHAEPGQDGCHHVTLHGDDWWITAFLSRAFVFDKSETALLRSTDRWKAGWGRRTLMVFKNTHLNHFMPPEFKPLVPIYGVPI